MGTRLGRYDVLKTLFKGELTDLLLARADGMEGFQRHVAVKRLHAPHAKDKACFDAFVNEARLAAALHHHNIVQVLDISTQDGQPYFAMEYVHGVDLRTLLNKLSKRNEQAPLQHVVSIIAAAAAALHHAHEQKGPDGQPLGIVHRDVTPGNILVGYDGNVKVVDFGIAKAAIKRIITDQGVLKGRVPYMAPEQCAGKPVDRRSDVFALGIVAYELATVRRLFKGASDFLTMSAIVKAEIPKPSQFRNDIPLELEQIMLKALARDPAQRYQSAGEMAMALDAVAVKVGVGASTTQLASYMRLQFGEVKEPWLDELDVDTERTDVDFDGEAAGLAPPPQESVKNNAIPKTVAATRSSPIAQVRNIITPSKPPGALDGASAPGTLVSASRPALPKPKPSVPMDKTYAMTTEVEALSYDDQPTDVDDYSDHIPTQRASRTSVAQPPPPHVLRPKPADPTEVVLPLRTMPTERPVVKPASSTVIVAAPGRTRSGALLWVGVIVAVVVVVAAAVVKWPRSDTTASAAPERSAETATAETAEIERKPPAEEAAAAEQPAQASSGMNATMADYNAAADPKVDENAAEQKAAEQKAADDKAAEQKADDDAKAAAEQAAELKAAEKVLVQQQAAEKKAAAQAIAEKKAADKKAAAEAAAEKAVAAKAAKRTSKSTPKPATKRVTSKRATAKKQGAKWNPDELFLGD